MTVHEFARITAKGAKLYVKRWGGPPTFLPPREDSSSRRVASNPQTSREASNPKDRLPSQRKSRRPEGRPGWMGLDRLGIALTEYALVRREYRGTACTTLWVEGA